MNTVSKMTVVCILAVLVVIVSSSRYSMIQVNAFFVEHSKNDPCAQPPSQEQEQACQESLQKQDCEMLKSKMTGNDEASDLYKKKDCAGLLGQ
jgi:hypothetical protein